VRRNNVSHEADGVRAQEDLEVELGHRFHKRELLQQALTHSSILPELEANAGQSDNEKLEFLGDAVLGLIASEYLVERFPEWSEGQLSKSRAQLVRQDSLQAAARRLNIGDYLRLGRGEEETHGREKPAVLADAFEAVVAALFLDAGLDVTRGFLCRALFDPALAQGAERLRQPDHKSGLQEFLQAHGRVPATYRVASESGPDHQKRFVIEVWIDGQPVGRAEGTSKKEAEQSAARQAMERLSNADPGG
jgi:ribonuclease-3